MLFQTVWDEFEGRPRGHGILDYDLFYCDPDVSDEAEDRLIRPSPLWLGPPRPRHFERAERETRGG
jgi:uncharacterized protein